MTLTDTRPATGAAAPADTAAAPVEHGVSAWIGTGDHKRLGLLFAAYGIVAVIVGLVCAFAYQLPSMADEPTAFVDPVARLSSAATVAVLVIGIPALWIGLATYVLPLQIGGHRVALPRLHNLAFWLFAGGGVLSAVAFFAEETRLGSLAAATPFAATEGEAASNMTELLIAAIGMVAIGTLLAAVVLLVTVVNRRAEGVRLRHVPAFAWSTFGTSLTLLLSTPVFVAGLVLLYFDQHYGGTVFASGTGGLRVWQHELWLLGRPEALVFAAAGIGLSFDVVATALRRPLVGWPVVAGVSVAAPLLTLLLWIGGLEVVGSPFAPLATPLTAVFLLPIALASLTWLASVRGSQPRVVPALVPFLAHLVPLVVVLVLMLVATANDVTEDRAMASFENGQLVLLSIGIPLLDLATGLVHWAPKLRGRVLGFPAAAAPALLLLAGTLLLGLPGHFMGLEAGDGVVTMGIVGAAVMVSGLVALLPTVMGPAGNAPSDPYEGLTLEWATASPPVRHDFDEIPAVRSPYPLYDARTATTTTTSGGDSR